MRTNLSALLAGVILLVLVCWMLHELTKAKGGHHELTGGGGVDPAPERDPAHDPPNAE